MKTKFSKTLFLIGIEILFITNAYAFELTYSDWSETYPNVDEILIEKEDRYYWYKQKEYDIEYLIKEDISDKLYDENDIKYITSDELYTEPENYSERIIESHTKVVNYSSKDVNGILITTKDKIEISEIVIKDNNDNEITCSSDDFYLNDGDFSTYYLLNDSVSCNFENKININDYTIFVFMRNDNENYTSFMFNLLSDQNDIIYSNPTSFKGNDFYAIIRSSSLVSHLTHYKTVYTYTDKLYKTYRLEKENVNEYYSNLDGYEKDESNKKTFYRYITNDYIIVDENGNLVTSEDYCKKEFCKLIYLTKKEEPEVVDNPKTYDSFYDYITLFIMSFIVLMYFIVKKCHTNNKSNIVESI